MTTNRKTLYVLVFVAVLALCDEELRKEDRAVASYERSIIRSNFRSSFMDRCGSLIDTEFICIFRMKRSSMERLRGLLFPFLKSNLSVAVISGRSKGNRRPLSVDEKICIGLMAYGGCTIGGLLFSFLVSKTTVYKAILEFVCAILQSDVGPIQFPQTQRELQDGSDAFQAQRCSHPDLHGCVGAGDGLAVRIRMPNKSETEAQLLYVNRKGFASVNVQAIASANCKCLDLCINTPGSTHDATAWELNPFSTKWDENPKTSPLTGRAFWIALDDAYGAGHNKVCPKIISCIYHLQKKSVVDNRTIHSV